MANAADSRNLAIFVYALQALGLLTAGAFFLVGIVINYLKYDDVRGTWVESHFRWQLATFWWGLLGLIVSSLTFWLLGLGWLIFIFVWLWALYRIVRGALAVIASERLPA